MFHVLLYVLHLIIQYVQALGRLIMRPLPHRGVCTDRKIEGCPRLLSRTPECPHGACLPLKTIYVFFSKEQRRASPRPTVPLAFISLSAGGELSGLQCKSSSGASSASPSCLADVSKARVPDGDHGSATPCRRCASLHMHNCPHFILTPLWLGATK